MFDIEVRPEYLILKRGSPTVRGKTESCAPERDVFVVSGGGPTGGNAHFSQCTTPLLLEEEGQSTQGFLFCIRSSFLEEWRPRCRRAVARWPEAEGREKRRHGCRGRRSARGGGRIKCGAVGGCGHGSLITSPSFLGVLSGARSRLLLAAAGVAQAVI